ncbi:MAG: DUF3160 domain-containing protein [Balneolaceae bacterium]
MKSITIPSVAFLLLLLLGSSVCAQSSDDFDLQAYLNFLEQNQNLSVSGIMDMYPMDSYEPNAPAEFDNALYSDSVYKYYQFNNEEIGLLEDNGFMVSDRIRYKSFGEAFFTIYKRDLPVYISSDAILHAIHMSYSAILKDMEALMILPRITELLGNLHDQLPELDTKYGSDAQMEISLKDVDLYLTVALLLLEEPVTPYFDDNEAEAEKLMEMIEAQLADAYPLFSHINRDIDFSQFTPRGHYTQSEALTRYFKTMMWLGRTEFYLIVPDAKPYADMSQELRDTLGQRQSINAYLVHEALQKNENQQMLEEINEVIEFLVGEQDNVTTEHLGYLKEKTGFQNAASLTNMETYKTLTDNLKEEPFAFQRILSQILIQDPGSPEGIKPAAAFMLLGQRFIIDSFILGNVVFDKVPSKRMLPKSADVLFALGNDDALLLLEDDLEEYGYASNLAALRYLVDSYESGFWQESFFNLWLNSIRKLNAPEDRTQFPKFTQTEAWSNKMMTTQLASWAQLRHDNLLYAKQSYTGGPVCEYPHSYVEPVPEFFEAVSTLSSEAKSAFSELNLLDGWLKDRVDFYFENLGLVADTLGIIAKKQLDGIENSEEEKKFLRGMLHESNMCGVELTGWYKDLFFTGDVGAMKEDFIVADVHTAPFDESGSKVGWVMHVGTGPLNLASIITELPDGNQYAFVGPVLSYYEHVSVNFKRLTDEEWASAFGEEPYMRPEFVNSYLSTSGEYYYDHRNYVATSTEAGEPVEEIQGIELKQNYPNPFNAGTVIGFQIPSKMANKQVELTIYNIQGQIVETLLSRPLSAGNYTVRWGGNAASGTYLYRLKVGDLKQARKMIMIK